MSGIVQFAPPSSATDEWLKDLLARNAGSEYLSQFGSPRTCEEFLTQVPTATYSDLSGYVAALAEGESDVLFAGRPIAYERTGGSSGGSKLIPYSTEGLMDFQRALSPWVKRTMSRCGDQASVYFSLSPATRLPELIAGVPVGVSDAQFLGPDLAWEIGKRFAVPFSTASVSDVSEWRAQTLESLRGASGLELISVWSPTFLLRLLKDLPDPRQIWPNLKIVSCWDSGPSSRYAAILAEKLPHARIEPKGLLSTETVTTVPNSAGQPVLSKFGFYEFLQGSEGFLQSELAIDETYELVVTTASGLYRYRTGDLVRYSGRDAANAPILEFVASALSCCDLVGEKLTEAFVSRCIAHLPTSALLIPDVEHPGYVLVSDNLLDSASVSRVEKALQDNPQYAYARKLEQLSPLRAITASSSNRIVEQHYLAQGTRLGDIKPLCLRRDAFWLPLFLRSVS
jgi:hypothetical protein